MIARIASLLRIKVPDKEPSGLLIASGKSLPLAGATGFQPGCLFILADIDTPSLYVNEGTGVHADFKRIFVVTAEQAQLVADVTATANEINTLVGITATAAQLNQLDVAAKTESVDEDSKTDGITPGSRVVNITGESGFTGLVLPLPTAAEVGMIKQITLDTITEGTVVMPITNIAVGGSKATTATFANAGDSLVLIGKAFGESFRWSVIAEDGVVLA